MVAVNIKCSEDQIFAIEEYLFRSAKLEVVPSERIRVYEFCKKKYPDKKIISAHLNLEDTEWEVVLGDFNEEEKAKED